MFQGDFNKFQKYDLIAINVSSLSLHTELLLGVISIGTSLIDSTPLFVDTTQTSVRARDKTAMPWARGWLKKDDSIIG